MREIKRNILKEQMGSNHIQNAWRNMQIKKFGFKLWLHIYYACGGKEINH